MLWTCKGLDPIYRFSCHCKVDHSVSLIPLQLWDWQTTGVYACWETGFKVQGPGPALLIVLCLVWVYLLGSDRRKEMLLSCPFSFRAWVFMSLPSLFDLLPFFGGQWHKDFGFPYPTRGPSVGFFYPVSSLFQSSSFWLVDLPSGALSFSLFISLLSNIHSELIFWVATGSILHLDLLSSLLS